MQILTNLILFFVPTLELGISPWRRLWQQEERDRFHLVVRIALFVYIAAYILHRYVVDLPLGLVSDRWFYYRYGLAAAGIVCLILSYLSKSTKGTFTYKVPFFLLGLATSYMQALSTTWSPEVHYLWGIFLPLAFVIVLGMTPLASILFCLVAYGLENPSYLAANVPPPLLIGAYISGLFLTTVVRRPMALEVKSFIQRNELIESEKRVADSRREMLEQVQGFLPRVINERISRNINQNQMSVLQAVDEELMPQTKMIVCLYSDIRGYTKKSKQAGYVEKNVIPSMQEAVTITEDHNGVPRVIGDLILAYFDLPDMKENIRNAVLSALQISRSRSASVDNPQGNQAVSRYFIVTSGEAIVGNIGGSGSGREITALGSCVNKSSRIDEYAKLKLQKSVTGSSLLVCQETIFLMADALPDLQVEMIDTGDQIRDFPGEGVGLIDLNLSVERAIEKTLKKAS